MFNVQPKEACDQAQLLSLSRFPSSIGTDLHAVICESRNPEVRVAIVERGDMRLTEIIDSIALSLRPSASHVCRWLNLIHFALSQLFLVLTPGQVRNGRRALQHRDALADWTHQGA